MDPPMVVYPMLGIAFIGIFFYGMSLANQKSHINLLKKEYEIKRLERYIDIKNLIQDGKTEEAEEAFRQFYNVYIK
jgi:hypothetical protein